MKKKNTWLKVVLTIVILEIIVGGVIFAYKKLNINIDKDNSISTKDKKIVALYEKIAYYDIESLDVMSPKTMLYYGYKNMDIKESINCDVVTTLDDTEGYTCEGLVDFIPSKDIEKSVKKIYGPNINLLPTSFELDSNHYAFYSEESNGYAVYTKDKEEKVDPVNMKLTDAKKEEENITLTVEVLDGVFGTVLNTYEFTFTKDSKDNNYYLTSKSIVKS